MKLKSIAKKRKSHALTVTEAADLIKMTFKDNHSIPAMIKTLRYMNNKLIPIQYGYTALLLKFHHHTDTLKITRHPIAGSLGFRICLQDESSLMFIETDPLKVKQYEAKNK